MAAFTERVTVLLSKRDLRKLDEIRGSQSPSAKIRDLIRDAVRDDAEPPSHEQALLLLAEQARSGSLSAAVELERTLATDELIETARRATT